MKNFQSLRYITITSIFLLIVITCAIAKSKVTNNIELTSIVIRNGLKEGCSYSVSNKIDLRGTKIVLPRDCEIIFCGGIIKNGSIAFTNTKLSGDIKFKDIKATGTLYNKDISSSWFNGKTDLLEWLCSQPYKNIDLGGVVYQIDNTLRLSIGSSYRNAKIKVVGNNIDSAVSLEGEKNIILNR